MGENPRRFKLQEHTIVYCTNNALGHSVRATVRNPEDADRIETEIQRERKALEQRRVALRGDLSELDALKTAYGAQKGLRLSTVLRQIKGDGEEAVRAYMSRAHWYRVRKDLIAAGVFGT